MYEELEYEYNDFLRDMNDDAFTFGRYFNEDDYEDEFSHNEINEYKEKFIDKVREYLHNNRPREFVLTSGWCVFIMTVDEAKERNMSRIDDFFSKVKHDKV